MRMSGFLWAIIGVSYYCYQIVSSLTTCDSSDNLYLLDGQLVQLLPDRTRKIRLEACNYWGGDIKPPIFDLDKDLMNVTQIAIRDLDMPPLPESSRLENVELSLASPTHVWGSCSHLRSLHVVLSDLQSMHRDWLANCTQLRHLSLNKPTIQEVQKILDSAPNLEVIDLYFEDIRPIVQYPLFPTARGREQSIREIRISTTWSVWEDSPEWSEVTAALIQQLSTIPRLRLLSFNEFLSFDFCATGNFSSVEFKSLEWLSLGKTSTSRLCFKEFRAMPQLNYLDLKNTKVAELKFSELLSARAQRLLVEFEELEKWHTATLDSLVFDMDDYLGLTDGSKKGNVTVSIAEHRKIKIDCDCKNAWFAKATREGLVTAPDVVCVDGSAPAHRPPETLECDKFSCGSCTCYRFWQDATVKVDCTGVKLLTLPADLLNMAGVTVFLASRSSLVTLPAHLPDRLLYLDLSDNNIWKLDATEVSALFGVKDRRVRFAGNPIVCTCENEHLLNALKENPGRVDDYKDIKCVGSNESLEFVDMSKLCAVRDREAAVVKAIVSVALLLAALMGLGGVAVYYYRTLKIFCFARGWCLYRVREDELDSNRVFDVFLSFCHADEAIIIEQLFPILDREYKVCVHFRDWMPGHLIPAQISNSVELSRRTVVVVSKNFVKSVWGMLEFRTAHMSALVEGRVRVVAVVLDDVLYDEEMQAELKMYLRSNTYLKWGEPWFWDKLRYALPHHPSPKQPQPHQPADNAAYEHPIEALQLQD
ncbi:protein toll-like [Pectinophora gossypiella]|nr:protein toll-like [Pectinophora gossypiella]